MDRVSVLVDNTSGMLGMSMRGMVLESVAPTSSARMLLEECVGMRLAAVQGNPVTNGAEVYNAMQGKSVVKLTFEAEPGSRGGRVAGASAMSVPQSAPPAYATSPITPGGAAPGDEVVVSKGPSGSTGCVFEDTVLKSIVPGSTAAAQGMEQYVGRVVTHVNNLPVTSLDAICEAAAWDPQQVAMRFQPQGVPQPQPPLHPTPSNPLLAEMQGTALRSATPAPTAQTPTPLRPIDPTAHPPSGLSTIPPAPTSSKPTPMPATPPGASAVGMSGIGGGVGPINSAYDPGSPAPSQLRSQPPPPHVANPTARPRTSPPRRPAQGVPELCGAYAQVAQQQQQQQQPPPQPPAAVVPYNAPQPQAQPQQLVPMPPPAGDVAPALGPRTDVYPHVVRSQAACYELEIRKAPEEPLGLNLMGMMLDSVKPGSPAARANAERFIGMQLTHVNGEPVSSLSGGFRRLQVATVRLRFTESGTEPNEVLVDKEPEEMVGTNFENMILKAVDTQSAAYRCGMTRFIGRRLHSINGRIVHNLWDIEAMFKQIDTSRLIFRFEETKDAPGAGEVLQLLPGTKIRVIGVTDGTVPNGTEGYIRGGRMLEGVNVAIVGFPAMGNDGDYHVRYENIDVVADPPSQQQQPLQIAAGPHAHAAGYPPETPPHAAAAAATPAQGMAQEAVSTVYGPSSWDNTRGLPLQQPGSPAWLQQQQQQQQQQQLHQPTSIHAHGRDRANSSTSTLTSPPIRPIPQPAQVISAPPTPSAAGRPAPLPDAYGAPPAQQPPSYVRSPPAYQPSPASPSGVGYTPLQPNQHPSYHKGFV